MNNYSIYESGDGGQLFIQNNNIQKTSALYVAVYLKLFGGNVEASTTSNDLSGELRSDWWGNDITQPSSTWINSETERVLKGISLTPAAIVEIEQAVLKDLEGLKEFGDIEVGVNFPSLNRVNIKITIRQVSEDVEILVVWDNTKNEVVQEIMI